jgi:hypothetical protein
MKLEVPANRRAGIVVLFLMVLLMLACRSTPEPTLTPTPNSPTPTVPPLVTRTPTATTTPLAPTETPVAPTRAATATSLPATPSPTPSPTSTPTPAPADDGLPPQPDQGPLPTVWTTIELSDEGELAVRYPTDIAVDAGQGVAYLLAACETTSLHEERVSNPCVATYDLEAERIRRVAQVPGSNYSGKILIGADALYLHYPWTNDLYLLDRATLELRQQLADLFGIALSPSGRVYLVDASGLRPIDGSASPQPVIRAYDNTPVDMVASDERVYVVSSIALQAFTADLRPLATLDLPEGQMRAIALDPAHGGLYISGNEELDLFDPVQKELTQVSTAVANAASLRPSPDGARLYALVRSAGWFGGTQVVVLDAATRATETLYTTLSNNLSAQDLAGGRLLLADRLDHALIPIDLESSKLGPRLPLGIEAAGAVVDAAHDRLFVSDSAGWIHVLNRQTYAEIDRIYGGREISLDAAHGRLYAGDDCIPEVTVYDPGTLEVQRTIAQSGAPRANAANGQVVIVNRRFYVYDGASGEQVGLLDPSVGEPPESCPGCYYTIGTDVVIDAVRGLTATITYTPWPGKPSDQISIDYDPQSGRAYSSLITGGYVAYSSISTYANLGVLQSRAEPSLHLEGLGGQIRLDPSAGRLYATWRRTLHVLDSETLQRLGRVEVPYWEPVIAGIDGELGRLYTPAGGKLVVWSRTGGAPPTPLPPEPVALSGVVTAIKASPDYAQDHTVLATIDEQLCRSTDGGETWVRLRGGLPEIQNYPLDVYAAFSPDYAEDGTIFFSGYLDETLGEGIWQSNDGGQTWQPSSTGLYDLRVYDLVLSPDYGQDGTLLAYVHTRPGDALYRSTDRGQSWTLITRQVEYGTPALRLPASFFPQLAKQPQFRCDFRGTCERSTDGGATWRSFSTGQFQMARLEDYALSPFYARDHLVYLLTETAVFRYHDDTGVGEIAADRPLYGPRDYTNAYTSIAAVATGEATSALLIGSNAAEFLHVAADEVAWEKVWPLPSAPTATPVPTPTPCGDQVDPRFDVDAASLERLGCATQPAVETAGAYQPFQRGRMFWRGDEKQIYVLLRDGTWATFQDTWVEGQPPADPAFMPPEGLLQPVRGFGKVWREQLGGPDAQIGWATEPESGGTLLIQAFSHGMLLRDFEGNVLILWVEDTWTPL